MRKLWIVSLLVIAAVSALAGAQAKGPIVRLDPGLDNIVSVDTQVEKLGGTFGFIEGPVWDRKGGYLLFSDIRGNVINKWDPKAGKASVFLERSGTGGRAGAEATAKSGSGGSNGLTLDPQGRIVIAAMGDRQIERLESDGRRTVLASEYEGKRLNGTNDLVYTSDGSLYFTDPPTALAGGDKDAAKELPFNGVFRIKDGTVRLVIRDLPRPNGVVFSPDEKYLYVCDTTCCAGGATLADRDKSFLGIYRYDVQRDGTVSNRKVFVDMKGNPEPGFPDGMKVDEKGNVYAGGPGGIWIVSPDGKPLGIILTPELATNMAFGDADGKGLYVTARTGLYRIRLKIPGVRP